ncbi:hypothetical protein MXB_378 [Myxobolus squamalis]|nr:hypothetical protein MXB_378 [Myxobolus squamalis]
MVGFLIRSHNCYSVVYKLRNMYNSQKKISIGIEGNISVGKTTFLDYIEKWHPSITVLREPMERWINVSGHNLFDNYLEDPARWGATFQVNFITTILEDMAKFISEILRKIV